LLSAVIFAPRCFPPSNSYGLSWAGQTFDDTTDGKPRGERVGAKIEASSGTFIFGVHPGTIAMLEVGAA
jgi:hypothetical protein